MQASENFGIGSSVTSTSWAHAVRPWAIMTMILSLAACQTGRGGPATVSLEEAKQITAEFSGSFTPPPKSINEILALINKGRPEPRACDGDPTLTDTLSKETGIPVIDGVGCAVKMVEALVGVGLATSKVGGYATPRVK